MESSFEVECFGDNVLIEILDAPKMMAGLAILEKRREEIMQRPIGLVAALGPDVNAGRKEDDKLFLRVGDRVLYYDHMAAGVHGLDGRLRRYLKAEHIHSKVKRDTPATAEQIKANEERARTIEQEEQRATGPGLVRAAPGAMRLVDAAGR